MPRREHVQLDPDRARRLESVGAAGRLSTLVEGRTIPVESLRAFSARVFEHFGVPAEDAALAAALSQPRPPEDGGFAHGQAVVPPDPGSQRSVKLVPPWRSRTNTSRLPFESSTTRVSAEDANAR